MLNSPWKTIPKPEACNFIKKEFLAQVLSCEFCEFPKNTFLTEHLRWLFFFPHNHKLLTEFNFIRFCRHFDIKKYLKSFKVLLFFSTMFPLLMYIFKKMCSNLASECKINDNNSKKLDES